MTCQNCSRRRFSGGSRNRKRSAAVPARHCLFSDLPQKAYRRQEIFSRDTHRLRNELKDGCSHGIWWIIRPPFPGPLRAVFFVMRQSRQAISPWSEAVLVVVSVKSGQVLGRRVINQREE